jgi:predicted HicB family RNase H-like nuclease
MSDKRADISKRVGADFFRSDKDAKVVIESKQYDSITVQRKEKTTFYISPELHRKLRIECAEKGKRISAFIEELLKNYFDSKLLGQ